jgi:hypothetical protein
MGMHVTDYYYGTFFTDTVLQPNIKIQKPGALAFFYAKIPARF